MKKTRVIRTTEEYEVCDLCGEEIDACNGNTVRDADGNPFYVHMMGVDACGTRALLAAVRKAK